MMEPFGVLVRYISDGDKSEDVSEPRGSSRPPRHSWFSSFLKKKNGSLTLPFFYVFWAPG